MKAKSIHGSTFEALKRELEKSMVADFHPTLAIVFTSIHQDRKALCELLSSHGIDIVGLTSCGEFMDTNHSNGETVMLLLEMPRSYFTILFEEVGGQTFQEAVTSLTRQTNEAFANSAMILCSSGFNSKGEYFDGEGLVGFLKKHLKPDTPFFGGMAGDDRTLSGSYVFTKGQDSDCAVMALVLDADKVQLQGIAITGWKKMGIARTVTRSEGNLLYTIDDLPAVDMYLKYLGRKDRTGDKEYRVLDELSMHYPFITPRDNGETVLRTPLKIDHAENALVIDVEMPTGTKFWFSMPPDFDIVDHILENASQMKAATRMEADALLIFSCAGRVDVLGPLIHSENEGLQKIWDTPMAGFFTYGEYGPDPSGHQEFHSGACCWVAMQEIS